VKKKEVKSKNPNAFAFGFLVGEGGFARLRAGRSAALACHRHAIHYRSPSNPPFPNTDTKAKTPSDFGWCFCLSLHYKKDRVVLTGQRAL